MGASLDISIPDYLIKDSKVYYSIYGFYKEIKEADVSTFEKLGYDYAKDSKYVYHMGKIVEGVDLPTFEISDNRIARNKFNIYTFTR